MRKRIGCVVLAMLMIIGCIPAFATQSVEVLDATVQLAGDSNTYPKQMEVLNRGAFGATAPSGGVYLSWRLLGSEPMDTVFNIYKDGVLFESGLDNTNYTDLNGTNANIYEVAPVINGTEGEKSGKITILDGHENSYKNGIDYTYFDIPVDTPIVSGRTYSPNDISVGDVDGDGEYELILKWDPDNSKDNASSGVTGKVFFDCYKMNGAKLWRIDMGVNIRAGAHYTQFQVYDYDGDGKAEIVMKTAPGSVDGQGNYVTQAGITDEIRNADNSADYRSSGYVLDGPEYLTIFNGETGAAMQTIFYDPPRGVLNSWGSSSDSKNRVDRFLAGTAYLDGVHPSVIMCRGYYGKAILAAYDWDGKNLTQRWRMDSTVSGNNALGGQGNHQLSIADIDNDGFDEIVYGAAAIDHDGSLHHSVNLKHGDALHVSDFNNDGKQEIFGVHEDNGGSSYRRGDGTMILRKNASGDTGRGIMANFSEKYGTIAWDSASGVYTTDGTVLSPKTYQDNDWSLPNFAIYWDGDLYREHFDGNRIQKFNDDTLSFGRIMNYSDFSGMDYNNSSKKNPCLQADLFGDWREELILRHADNSAIRVFASIAPTDYKFTTFMHDSQYRTAVAWQNTAYNQPPHQSYFIGYEKDEYVQPNIYYAPLPITTITVKDQNGAALDGAVVSVDGTQSTVDENGVATYRLLPGEHSYTVKMDNYISKSGTFVVLEGEGADVSVTLSQKIYIYDSNDDETGSRFAYTGDSGATLTFSGSKEWQFEQNSTDGGREFGGDFEASNGGNMELEFIFNTGGRKSVSDEWNWTGRTYSYDIKLVDSTGATLLGLSQAYSASGAEEAQYYSGVVSKKNISTGSAFGAPNITKRSSTTWKVKVNADLDNKLAELIFSDDTGENGFIIENIALSTSEFAALTIGSTAPGNVTWGPKLKNVLYWTDSIAPPTIDPTKPTATPKPTAGPTAEPTSPPTAPPTEVPYDKETWDFNDLAVGDTYGDRDDNKAIANQNGKNLDINFGTSALGNAVPPTIAERAGGDNYLQLTDMGGGQDSWTYEPSQAIDGDVVIVEMDFKPGDTAKDTPLIRVFDVENASYANTYVSENTTDGRIFEVKTSDGGMLKFSDYFSKGASDTKALDIDVSGFSFVENRWYGIKLEYTKSDSKVKVYTKQETDALYTLRRTVTLGSGTKKVSEVPQLALTKVSSSTRGSSAGNLGIDNINVGARMDIPDPTGAPEPTPTGTNEPVPTLNPTSAPYDYEISGAAFGQDDKLNVIINYVGSGTAKDAKLLVGTYENEQTMTNSAVYDIKGSASLSLDYENPENGVVKLYIWNGTDTINPLSVAKTVEQAPQPTVGPSATPNNLPDNFVWLASSASSVLKSGELTTKEIEVSGAKIGPDLKYVTGLKNDAAASYTHTDGKKYNFSTAMQGGGGSETNRYISFVPKTSCTVTVVFNGGGTGGLGRIQNIGQSGNILESATAAEGFVQADISTDDLSTVYTYGGGSNKNVFAIFVDYYVEEPQKTITGTINNTTDYDLSDTKIVFTNVDDASDIVTVDYTEAYEITLDKKKTYDISILGKDDVCPTVSTNSIFIKNNRKEVVHDIKLVKIEDVTVVGNVYTTFSDDLKNELEEYDESIGLKISFTKQGDIAPYDETTINQDGTFEATLLTDEIYDIAVTDGGAGYVLSPMSTSYNLLRGEEDLFKNILLCKNSFEIAYSDTVYVGADKEYKNPNQAITAIRSMTDRNDRRVTVVIDPGTYFGQTTVDADNVTFTAADPENMPILSNYYARGYVYYSLADDGLYDADFAAAKTGKNIVDLWGPSTHVNADGFIAEYIDFENTFNQYITEAEIEDGVEPGGPEPQTFVRELGKDVTIQAATERAAAVAIGDGHKESEFYKCIMKSNQDTLYTGTGTSYVKECRIYGNADYIFGGDNVVFEQCDLIWYGYSDTAKGGHISASWISQDTARGYLFNNCTVKNNEDPNMKFSTELGKAGTFGRNWGGDMSRTLFNNVTLDVETKPRGWSPLGGPIEYADLFVNGAYKKGSATDLTEEADNPNGKPSSVPSPEDYLGDWAPKYFIAE